MPLHRRNRTIIHESCTATYFGTAIIMFCFRRKLTVVIIIILISYCFYFSLLFTRVQSNNKIELIFEQQDNIENERGNSIVTSKIFSLPSSYNDLVKMNVDINIPTNLNVVMMGDSITRYQYISLAYFLSHGQWWQNGTTPNLLWEKSVPSWVDYYNYTNAVLQPFEKCDCYREEPLKQNLNLAVENRYFFDHVRNNRIIYLQKFGIFPFQSSWNVNQVPDNSKLIRNSTQLNINVKIKTWSKIISNFVCKMEPKPDIFIFNQGLWQPTGIDDPNIQLDIVKSLQLCGIKSMYKSTTIHWGENRTEMKEYEKQLCNLTDYCHDMTWTQFCPENVYWDNYHFLPIGNTWMNVLLLEHLSSLNKQP